MGRKRTDRDRDVCYRNVHHPHPGGNEQELILRPQAQISFSQTKPLCDPPYDLGLETFENLYNQQRSKRNIYHSLRQSRQSYDITPIY